MPVQDETVAETRLIECGFADTIRAQDFFAASRPIWVARAPGRLDVMGGNVDYTGGMVLQSLLREAVWVATQPRMDGVIRILNPGAVQFGWASRLEVQAEDLRNPDAICGFVEQVQGAGWTRYVLGALYFLKDCLGAGGSGGADVFIASDLPPTRVSVPQPRW